MQPGPKNLITDVPGLLVGNAEDAALKSGVTVLTADRPFTASVSVMGGAPGTRETDLLAPDKTVAQVDALVLSGGSSFGLAAADGVAGGLRAKGRGFAVGAARVPLVPAAILFDLLNGGDKGWDDNPYPALGRRAFEAADTHFALGTAGAGTGALTAMLKGGLGSASLLLDTGVTVGALVAANPVGSATTPGERHFWAAPYEIGEEFGALGIDPAAGL
ncbi:MAG: P1 family peptidase, partial [Rhodosalinus sp.]